jgi:hypothetical protein
LLVLHTLDPSAETSCWSGPGELDQHLQVRPPADDRYLRHESALEDFLVKTTASPLSVAVEQTLTSALNAATVTLWEDIPSLHLLYSLRMGTTVAHRSAGLARGRAGPSGLRALCMCA